MTLTRRSAIRLAAVGPAIISSRANGQSSQPPNILFLYTDDQARWAASPYGNRDVYTPNLEQIAREGAVFEQAFVTTPVCSPSRAGMLTSQYSFRTKIHDFIDVRREPELGLDAAFPTWPGLLQKRGYRTGLFGKWHLGTRPEHHPTRRGYHEFMGFLEGGNRPMDPFLEIDGVGRRVSGSLPDLLTDAALEFINKHRAGPFVASVHFRAPHSPYGPVPEQDQSALAGRTPDVPEVEGVDRTVVTTQTAAYYKSIASVDRNIGRMLDALDSLDLAKNTIVIFTSDNGYMIGHHGAHGKGNATGIQRGGRARVSNMFDHSLLTPLIIRDPGTIKTGKRISEPVLQLDLFPTLLTIGDATKHMPDGYQPCGRDLASLLRGQAVPWRNVVYGDYDMYHYLRDSMRMIRTPKWKLVTHSHPAVQHELYDLLEDPGETTNLIGAPQHAPILRELRQRLHAWQQWHGDPATRSPSDPM